MSIIIDVAGPEIEPTSNVDWLKQELGYRPVLHTSRNSVARPVPRSATTSNDPGHPNLVVDTLWRAYADGASIELTPRLVWHMIISQIGELRRQHPASCDWLLQRPDVKQNFRLDSTYPGNNGETDWTESAPLLHEMLSDALNDNAKRILFPRCSVNAYEDELALLTALFDPESPCYTYTKKVGPGGIPRIRLAGTLGDWEQIVEKTHDLAQGTRDSLGQGHYFFNLLSILEEFTKAAEDEPDKVFWGSILTRSRDDSGAALPINGWLGQLFAYTYRQDGIVPKMPHDQPAAFPAGVSKVPFILEDGKDERHLFLAGGALGVDYEGGALALRLGYAIAAPHVT